MSLSGKEQPTITETSPLGESAETGSAEGDANAENKKEGVEPGTQDINKDEENKETEQNVDEQEGGETEDLSEQDKAAESQALNIDLSRMKSLYEFRSRPTLPYLLTEYGMEDKGAPVLKHKDKEKKKKKRESFGDDTGRDKEKERLTEERQLQVLDDMKKLRDFYYDEYSSLLQNKVDQQRHDIRQHSKLMRNKLSQQEETARQESHHLKRRSERHTVVSDDSFLEDLPKSDLFYIVQLQDKLIKEGTLKSQTDFDTFWQRIQQPEIFYMYFKVPKSDDMTLRENFNDNASSKGASTWKGSASTLKSGGRREYSPPPIGEQNEDARRALSRIAESRETSRPGTRVGQHWAITQQFPSQQRESSRDKHRRSSFTGLKNPAVSSKSSYLHDLEKRFPKLEMPKLHCFTMNLGPKSADPGEVLHQRNLRELEKNRKKYTYKLTKMHQLAMANAAATSRILEMHEDMDFIINGAPLTDLISDQHWFSGPPPSRPPRQEGPTSSSPVQDRQHPSLLHTLPSVFEHDEKDLSLIHSQRSSKKSGSAKSRRSKKAASQKPIETEPASMSPFPLSLGEVVGNTHVLEAKCMSTLWTNYMKDAPTAQT